jgi:DNA-binding transcriptional MerR regulator
VVSQTSSREASSGDTYTVGQLAAELGVTTRTLRFYEEAGIVTPARTGSGAARSYDARDRARLVLALRGKRFGMSLAEIREIVDMYDAEPGEAGQIQRLLASLESVREDLVARRTELTRTLREVDDVSRRCQARLAELAAGTETPRTSRTSRGRTSAPPPATGGRSGRLGAAANASSPVTGAHHR